jgi:hypothetical protein
MTNISEGRDGSRNSVARRGASDAFPNADTHRGIEASRLVYTRSYIESLALQKTKKASTARCPNLDMLQYIKHQCAVQIRTIAHKMKACTHRRQQIGHVAGCMQCRSLRCVSPSTCMPVRNRKRTRVLGMHAGVEERSSGAKRSDSESRDVWGLRQRRRHGARFIGRVRAARALGQSARTETR